MPLPQPTLQDRRSLTYRWFGALTINGLRHNMLTLISTALGGGVLSMAYVMKEVGLILGVLMLITGSILALISIKALMEMSTITGCDTYASLFSHCAGPKAGLVLDAMLFVYGFGSITGYFVFLGDFIPAIVKRLDPYASYLLSSRESAIFGSGCLLVPMVLLEDLSALRFVTPFSICALIYMAILVASKSFGFHEANVGQAGFGDVVLFNPSTHMFEAFSICVFAFNCHLNVVPVAGKFVRPTSQRFAKVSLLVNMCEVGIYSFIGITGYLSFLQATKGDIINNYPPHDTALCAGRCMLSGTMMVAICMVMHPTVRSLLQLKDNLCPPRNPLLASEDIVARQSGSLRIPFALVTLVLSGCTAYSVPEVNVVLGLLGATVATLMMFVIPAYAMGVVLPPSRKRRAKQWLLYAFSFFSAMSLPVTVLEWVKVVPKPT